jgi:uncharacterized linocin/CFP29 family protein
MGENDSQVPWTDEQWARVNQVIQQEASRARVAATFLPLFGPLPANTDFVRKESIDTRQQQIKIEDTDTIKVPTLQVRVYLRGAQMADPEMKSALALFRRAANVLARLEDDIVFNGLSGPGMPRRGLAGLQGIYGIQGGQDTRGLLEHVPEDPQKPQTKVEVLPDDSSLVARVSESIGKLEGSGHFGPFAVVLGQKLFLTAQTPNPGSLVLPQDRIIPFLGGGSLLRSSTLPEDHGVVVALGGEPVELIVATDMSLSFLQVTPDPIFVFRVFEKVVLRIKEPNAIVALVPERENVPERQKNRSKPQGPKK